MPKSQPKPYQKLTRLFRSLNSIPESIENDSMNNITTPIASTSEAQLNDNSFATNNLASNTQAALAFSSKAIFESLKIPDAVKDLPNFEGNPRLLYDFINNVEEILIHLSGLNQTPYANIILRAIRNKIRGQANEVLNMYGTNLDWDEMKENLVLHYSDKRNETSLIKDLHRLKQGTKTIEEFHSEVVELQAALNNNVRIHETNQNVITAKRQLFHEMCLNTFLSGLREPLGSSIRAMKPSTLALALSYCNQEQNMFYMKNAVQKPQTQYQGITNYFPFPLGQHIPTHNQIFHRAQNQQSPNLSSIYNLPFRSYMPYQNFQYTQNQQTPNLPSNSNIPFRSFMPHQNFQNYQAPNFLNNANLSFRPFMSNQNYHRTPQNSLSKHSIPNQNLLSKPNENLNTPRNQTSNTNRPLPPPEPMELGSEQSRFKHSTNYRPSTNYKQPSNITRRTAEMHNVDAQEPPSYLDNLNQFYTYEDQPEDQFLSFEDQQALEALQELDEGNFPPLASNNQLDT